MKKAALMIGLLALVGCKKVKATVNCEVKEGPTVECVVAQTEGSSEAEVCWDFKVTCANNASLEAELTCAKVKEGGSTTVTTPTDKIKLVGKCEGERKAGIGKMTINGKVVETTPL